MPKRSLPVATFVTSGMNRHQVDFPSMAKRYSRPEARRDVQARTVALVWCPANLLSFDTLSSVTNAWTLPSPDPSLERKAPVGPSCDEERSPMN